MVQTIIWINALPYYHQDICVMRYNLHITIYSRKFKQIKVTLIKCELGKICHFWDFRLDFLSHTSLELYATENSFKINQVAIEKLFNGFCISAFCCPEGQKRANITLSMTRSDFWLQVIEVPGGPRKFIHSYNISYLELHEYHRDMWYVNQTAIL